MGNFISGNDIDWFLHDDDKWKHYVKTVQSKIMECEDKTLKLLAGAVASSPSLISCEFREKDNKSVILLIFK